MILIIGLLFQLNLPTPDFPALESPTPVPTFTPMPTMDYSATPVTGLLSNLQTAEANVSQLPTQIAVDEDGSVRLDGEPITPDEESFGEIWSYLRWLTSTASEEILGPFAPMSFIFGLFIFASAIFVFVTLWQTLISVIIRGILAFVRYVIPGFG